MARATLAPVIGSRASCSQKSVWRYSCSATVARRGLQAGEDRACQIRVEPDDPRRAQPQLRVLLLRLAEAPERRVAGRRGVQHRAQAPDIGGRARLATADLLGRG